MTTTAACPVFESKSVSVVVVYIVPKFDSYSPWSTHMILVRRDGQNQTALRIHPLYPIGRRPSVNPALA